MMPTGLRLDALWLLALCSNYWNIIFFLRSTRDSKHAVSTSKGKFFELRYALLKRAFVVRLLEIGAADLIQQNQRWKKLARSRKQRNGILALWGTVHNSSLCQERCRGTFFCITFFNRTHENLTVRQHKCSSFSYVGCIFIYSVFRLNSSGFKWG